MSPRLAPDSPTSRGAVSAANAKSTLAGFYLSGLLMSFLGAILPAWGYHLQTDYTTIGHYFLSLNVGILLSVPLARMLLDRTDIRRTLLVASGCAALSFFYLAAMGPPAALGWRVAGLAFTGVSAGILNAGLFSAVSPMYRRDRAAAINLSGLVFGLGCLSTALLVAGTYYVYTIGATLIFLGLIPAFLAGKYARWKVHNDPVPESMTFRQAVSDVHSPQAMLFALLLFFQFGNEWSVAGWLPLFLGQRLGVSQDRALLLLATYWLALLLGRIAAQAILPRVHHGKILAASVVASVFGCVILTMTDNLFGAAAGLVITGAGFSTIYPLVVERIGDRFPYYHPGLFNGLFSLAVTGGLLAPASLGYIVSWFGIGAVMMLPLIGSCAVCVILVIIWIEAKLLGLVSQNSQS